MKNNCSAWFKLINKKSLKLQLPELIPFIPLKFARKTRTQFHTREVLHSPGRSKEDYKQNFPMKTEEKTLKAKGTQFIANKF